VGTSPARVDSHQDVASSAHNRSTSAASRAVNDRTSSPGAARNGRPKRTVTCGRPGTGQLRPRGIAANAPRTPTGTTGTPALIAR